MTTPEGWTGVAGGVTSAEGDGGQGGHEAGARPSRRASATERLFAEAVRKNPRWAGLPLVRLGSSSIVMPHPDTWVPAHCSVCDRPLGAIGAPGKAMLVPPGEERSGPDGPQYRCADRGECERYAAGQARARP